MSSGRTEIPAGLELVYDLEKQNVSSAFDAFVLSLHWSIVRTGLRIRAPNTTTEYTERLPPDWPQRNTGESTRTLTLNYYDPHNSTIKYELKVIELTSNDLVAVTFFRSGNKTSGSQASTSKDAPGTSVPASANRPASDKSSGVEKNSAASTFQIGNFIRVRAFEEGKGKERAVDVYEHADLLEVQLYETIMEPLGLRVMGQPPVQGPYDDANKSEKSTTQPHRDPLAADDRFYRPGLGRHPSPISPGFPNSPLHVPPVGGPGGLGRSDLDPLGRFGAGNVLDPRGFRTPRGGGLGGGLPTFPGGPPPGARFDPFGPPNPARPDGTGGNFFMPNPDHERPSSDYDDMFM